jgi:hypothetical protein
VVTWGSKATELLLKLGKVIAVDWLQSLPVNPVVHRQRLP